MTAKLIIPIIVVSLVLVGGVAVFAVSKSKPTPKTVPVAVVTTPTPTPVALLTWTDEAGFSFQYPAGTSIDKHPEDTKNYANLTLTLPDKGVVNIIMSDNKFKNLDAVVGQESAIDTTLGGQLAKKTITEEGSETIYCIDNDVLVTITGKDLTTIVKSWTFIYPTQAPAKSTQTTTTTDENVLEEE